MKKIAIIGGGAAGLMASVFAAKESGVDITLFEKNAMCAKKIGITGKGRCNLTNASTVPETESMIPCGAKFLRTALYFLPPDEVMSFFEKAGVPLKTERGNRVFPQSDRARDIAIALTNLSRQSGTKIVHSPVMAIQKDSEGFRILLPDRAETFDRVLIATGGASYPGTGSTGDGYRFARELGHRIEPPLPSLIPLVTKETFPADCMGLSLKNTALRIRTKNGKTVYEDFGEMLFCHFGVSGPMILSASAYLDFKAEKEYQLELDLKPALTPEELDKRILSDFRENQNRDLVNALSRLLPQKLIRPMIRRALLDERKKVNLITKEERLRLVGLLKALPLTVIGTRPLTEAIITRGGVSLKEVNPRTMESRLVPGLYFAGEVLDADGLTGGFNLQIAFSTGALAGNSMVQEDL